MHQLTLVHAVSCVGDRTRSSANAGEGAGNGVGDQSARQAGKGAPQ